MPGEFIDTRIGAIQETQTIRFAFGIQRKIRSAIDHDLVTREPVHPPHHATHTLSAANVTQLIVAGEAAILKHQGNIMLAIG